MRISAPWFVPPVQPIELFFFQRVFQQLRERKGRGSNHDEHTPEPGEKTGKMDHDEHEVSLMEFKRAMVRLFRVLKDERRFDLAEYDVNKNGRVGWFEFCSLWKERGVYVRLSLAERVFLTLEDAERSIFGKIWSVLIFVAIVISIFCFILSTLPEMQQACPKIDAPDFDEQCRPTPKWLFGTIDLYCISLFTIEYVVRLVLSAFMRTELVESDKRILLAWMVSDDVIQIPTKMGRVMQWTMHWSNLIDLAAILPWYVMELFKSQGSDKNLFLKVIRLTRVIRAFRLGRRFEAVIIIMRSVRRSLRALYVLVLNLSLGIIIFGALMYFAEQGTWEPETKTYIRWEDDTTQSRSPFESIPACFWWAIITATTVGYGDHSTPRTLPGKLVATLTTVWSLCVLALPIGVIGGNFTQVWEEYDRMKQQDEENRFHEEALLRRSVAWSDVLHHSKRLVLELWHDSGLSEYCDTDIQSEFMGEVAYTLDLNPAKKVEKKGLTVPLSPNYSKARRKVRGSLTFAYSWQPVIKTDPDKLLQGRLDITVVGADSLLSIDWKHFRSADPYCIIIAHPHSPGEDGCISDVVKRTRTVFNTIAPRWNETLSFDVCWMRDASKLGLVADMKRMFPLSKTGESTSKWSRCKKAAGPQQNTQGDTDTSDPSAEAKLLHRTVPQLREDVTELKSIMPRLQMEIGSVRRDMQLVLAALECQDRQCACSAASGTPEAQQSASALSSGLDFG